MSKCFLGIILFLAISSTSIEEELKIVWKYQNQYVNSNNGELFLTNDYIPFSQVFITDVFTPGYRKMYAGLINLLKRQKAGIYQGNNNVIIQNNSANDIRIN
jgi:hypothetical protein